MKRLINASNFSPALSLKTDNSSGFLKEIW
jgi:hypothetical protein